MFTHFLKLNFFKNLLYPINVINNELIIYYKYERNIKKPHKRLEIIIQILRVIKKISQEHKFSLLYILVCNSRYINA